MENGTMESVAVEQRHEIRQDLSWPISIWLPEANRFFNGKSVNVSKGGAFISVPMTTPVAAGNEIEINFPRTQTLAKEKGQYARIKNAKVLRVDRRQVLSTGTIGIAVEFEG
ncbi:MAG: PilZ domain-containing protein [Planctomycetota bacterium]